jgi:hypothetical protein
MNRYGDLLSALRKTDLIDEFQLVTADQLASLRKDFSGIPEDYVDFLGEIGWGTFGDGLFGIYEGPISPEDIYDPITAARFRTLWLIGDDYSGYNIAFDAMRAWSIVGIDSANMEVNLVAKTFEAFIRPKASNLIKIRSTKKGMP